jgi:hypothetical protein
LTDLVVCYLKELKKLGPLIVDRAWTELAFYMRRVTIDMSKKKIESFLANDKNCLAKMLELLHFSRELSMDFASNGKQWDHVPVLMKELVDVFCGSHCALFLYDKFGKTMDTKDWYVLMQWCYQNVIGAKERYEVARARSVEYLKAHKLIAFDEGRKLEENQDCLGYYKQWGDTDKRRNTRPKI